MRKEIVPLGDKLRLLALFRILGSLTRIYASTIGRDVLCKGFEEETRYQLKSADNGIFFVINENFPAV